MSQTTDPEKKPTLKSTLRHYWKKLTHFLKVVWERLNLIELLATIGGFVQRLILSFEGILLLIMASAVGISCYSIYHNLVRLTSAIGLFWLLLFLLIFMLAAMSKKGLDAFNKNIKLDTQQADSHLWYVLLINNTMLLLLKGVRAAMNTIMGVSIMLAFILTEMHASAATGDFQLLWQKEAWSYLDVAFIIVAPLSGMIYDVSQIGTALKKRSGFTLVFGIAQFFISFIFLATGLFGGEAAILAIDFIIYSPVQWLFVELPSVEYQASSAYQIISNTGTLVFIFLYCLIPLNLALAGYSAIEKHRDITTTDEPELPLRAAQGLLYFSSLFLLIVLYVAWQQGWIMNILEWILYIVIIIFELIWQLLSWIIGLFQGG